MKATIWNRRGAVFHTLRVGETMQEIHARCWGLRDYTPNSFPLWVIDDGEMEEGQFLPLRVFVDARNS